MFTYDFGYAWTLSWGHLLVCGTAALLAVLVWRRHWPRAVVIACAALAAWALAGAVAMHYAVQIASPSRVPAAAFAAAGDAELIELGAGSGRATVGMLRARPAARVTAVDAYAGYYGIADNTPERLLRNARAAGVADRVQVQVADMRALPFGGGRFDAAFSVAAIDHLPWDGIAQALQETARVLKPGGQLLIVSLRNDAWLKIAMPWSVHGHGYWGATQSRQRWSEALERAGFAVTETGTAPATWYVLAQTLQRRTTGR